MKAHAMSFITHFSENISSGINLWAFLYFLLRAVCLVGFILWGAGGSSSEGSGFTDSVADVCSRLHPHRLSRACHLGPCLQIPVAVHP